MSGCLEHPAFPAATPLEVLQHPAVHLIGGAEVPALEPLEIGREAVGGFELIAQERMAEDDKTLLGERGRDGMDAVEVFHHPVKPAYLPLHEPDPPVAE